MSDDEDVGRAFADFVGLIERLRDPGGCPWDREQTHESLKGTAIEEAYEVVEAIDGGNPGELAGELGDLLLQVVFHADIARRAGDFDLAEILRRVSEKMIRRHPHVFADDDADTSKEVLRNWEALKAEERRAKGQQDESLLDSVPKSLPALMEALQTTTKAGRVGFDWPDAPAVLDKVAEELSELREEAGTEEPAHARLADETGDLLFAAVNAARLLGVDPEAALKSANRKFRRRFAYVERRLSERGRSPEQSDLAEMDALWNEAKRDPQDGAP